MTTINLTTKIKASLQIVFDVSRSIDIHQQSASKTNEKAIAGITTGYINKGETVTWRSKHFGIYLEHQSIITEMELPIYFVDKQLEGHFKTFKHQHLFEEINGVTTMIDILEYETPFGLFGKLFDFLFLKKHLTVFLLH